MDEKLYTIRECIKNKMFPLGDMKLRQLIWAGERKKKGEDVGSDYIRAVNLGSEGLGAKWGIPADEIQSWIKRKANKK